MTELDWNEFSGDEKFVGTFNAMATLSYTLGLLRASGMVSDRNLRWALAKAKNHANNLDLRVMRVIGEYYEVPDHVYRKLGDYFLSLAENTMFVSIEEERENG